MTRLRRGESLQADGIRDMMESHDGNGSSSSMAMNSTKIWERQPIEVVAFILLQKALPQHTLLMTIKVL